MENGMTWERRKLGRGTSFIPRRTHGALDAHFKAMLRAEEILRADLGPDLGSKDVENLLANTYMRHSARCAAAVAICERRTPRFDWFGELAARALRKAMNADLLRKAPQFQSLTRYIITWMKGKEPEWKQVDG